VAEKAETELSIAAVTSGSTNVTTLIAHPAKKDSTQKDAIDAANRMLKNQGGGELTTKGRDGKIRSKDTIPPGDDPNPPRDREH